MNVYLSLSLTLIECRQRRPLSLRAANKSLVTVHFSLQFVHTIAGGGCLPCYCCCRLLLLPRHRCGSGFAFGFRFWLRLWLWRPQHARVSGEVPLGSTKLIESSKSTIDGRTDGRTDGIFTVSSVRRDIPSTVPRGYYCTRMLYDRSTVGVSYEIDQPQTTKNQPHQTYHIDHNTPTPIS